MLSVGSGELRSPIPTDDRHHILRFGESYPPGAAARERTLRATLKKEQRGGQAEGGGRRARGGDAVGVAVNGSWIATSVVHILGGLLRWKNVKFYKKSLSTLFFWKTKQGGGDWW